MTRSAVLSTILIAACAGPSAEDDLPPGPAPSIDGVISSPDADAPDAQPPDASLRGPVTVSVLSEDGDGLPQSGARVLFIDPDDSVVGVVTTGSDGLAHGEVLPGASVTVVRDGLGWSDDVLMTSILGVEPGDQLVSGARADATVVASMTVSFPALAGVSGSYALSNGCDTYVSSQTSFAITFLSRCAPAQTSLLVVARGSDGQWRSVAAVDQPLVDGGSIDIL
ncbi:MAG TPA: hypothetical protein VL172_21700, partial [Kofleriaceae bacterium]|nr:hypothetical protein [Kofleriaceae bacterium]